MATTAPTIALVVFILISPFVLIVSGIHLSPGVRDVTAD
jgi:hypothetical protein